MLACLLKLKMTDGLVCLLALGFWAVPLQAETSGTTTTPVAMAGQTWAQKSTVEKVQLICALSALPVFFVAEVWFIVAGSKLRLLGDCSCCSLEGFGQFLQLWP